MEKTQSRKSTYEIFEHEHQPLALKTIYNKPNACVCGKKTFYPYLLYFFIFYFNSPFLFSTLFLASNFFFTTLPSFKFCLPLRFPLCTKKRQFRVCCIKIYSKLEARVLGMSVWCHSPPHQYPPHTHTLHHPYISLTLFFFWKTIICIESNSLYSHVRRYLVIIPHPRKNNDEETLMMFHVLADFGICTYLELNKYIYLSIYLSCAVFKKVFNH